MTTIKFEVGKTYTTLRGVDTLTVSKRTDKTIWFCDDYFSARIRVKDGIEYIQPNIGMIKKSYRANLSV